MAQERLRLRARDADDLAVIAACVQDALVPVVDMAFLPTEKRFVLALNRFRWDLVDAGNVAAEPGIPFSAHGRDAPFWEQCDKGPAFERASRSMSQIGG